MKIMRVTYYALAALFSVASCSKEATEQDVYDWDDGKIYFKTSLRDVVSSRAKDMTLDGLESFQVTCFNTADKNKDQSGYISPYFENATFIREGAAYGSAPEEDPCNWPATSGLMRFFAFSPSLSVMASNNSAITDANKSKYLNLINRTVENGSSVSVGYSLGAMRINPDISRQFDFVTAEASGDRWLDFAGGVELAFSHQLCQIELRAWGEGTTNNFEIAGVRLGNPVVEGTFIFADDSTPEINGKWENTNGGVKDKVEYLYQLGDRIYDIKATEHNTSESAASIMGNGGCAMVIPSVNQKWEGLEDPNIGNQPYSTDRMYFSILTRVTDPASGSVVYPYPGNKTGMTVVSYAVDKDRNILSRLYAGQKTGTYYTDPELQHPYVAATGEEILDFGWAAVPVDADWSAGKKYIYTLNYSEGIGLHDPEDPEPGKLIVGQLPIEWSVKVSGWDYAEKDENYDPELNVP